MAPTEQHFGVNSPWGNILRWVMARYRDSVYFVEIMNEPNLLWWPQRYVSTGTEVNVAACAAAQMIITAKAIQNSLGGAPLLMAPATSDERPLPQNPNGDGRTRSASFVQRVIEFLQAYNFTDHAGICWTTHNYADVACDIGEHSVDQQTIAAGSDVAGKTNAHVVQQLLEGWWKGWPYADPDLPYVLITEGGGSLNLIGQRRGSDGDTFDSKGYSFVLAKQSSLILRNWKRMKGDADPSYADTDAAGIGMVPGGYTWFPTSVGATDDAALHELMLASGGTPRPAYATWKAL